MIGSNANHVCIWTIRLAGLGFRVLAPVAVDGNAATKKCVWKGKEGWDTSLCGSESDNPHTHKLLTATQPRAGAGARAGAEFADACTGTLACARVVATMLATTAVRAAAVARGIRANACKLAHTACPSREAVLWLCWFFLCKRKRKCKRKCKCKQVNVEAARRRCCSSHHPLAAAMELSTTANRCK